MWAALIFLLAQRWQWSRPLALWFARRLLDTFRLLISLYKTPVSSVCKTLGQDTRQALSPSCRLCLDSIDCIRCRITGARSVLHQADIAHDVYRLTPSTTAHCMHALRRARESQRAKPYETLDIDAIDATPGQCRTLRTHRYHARAKTSIAHDGAPRVVAKTERPERHEGCCGARAGRRRRAESGK